MRRISQQFISANLPTRSFNRVCLLVAGLFLAVTLTLRGNSAASGWQDFPQYYLGGLMIRTGHPDALYPTPDPQSDRNPGWADGSTMKPAAARAWHTYAPYETNRYMSPPPLAVLLVPLTFFSLPTAAWIWTAVLGGSVLAIGWQAGRVYELCVRRRSRVAGLLVLLVCTSLLAHRCVRVANISPLAAAVTWACVLLLLKPSTRVTDAASAFCFTLGAVLKLFTLALAPLYVVTGRWRVLVGSILMGVGVVLLTLPFTGVDAWSEFVHVVLPLQNRPSFTTENQAIRELLLRLLDTRTLPPAALGMFLFFKYATLAGLLGAVVWRRREIKENVGLTCAAALALLVWLFAFGPLFWDHYQAFLLPFWGWLLFEARQRGFGRIVAFTSIALVICPLPAMGWVKLPEPFNSHLLIGSLLMGTLAGRRLLVGPRGA